ncbi:MAG TPA: ABC transporter substrate-binding protein [Stellaceae bacterium]|nr:ABC transporter substrate-binding protein [Stellaceae bacterium]
MRRGLAAFSGVVLAGVGAAATASAAESVTIGVSRLQSCAPVAVAMAKGYFTAEGLDVHLSFFDAQQPIAVGVTSGDLDFGVAAETAALYSLAAEGNLHIIAGGAGEEPTFHYLSIVASNQAYAAGLKSPKDLAGHSFALTQMGTGLQYSLGLLAEKYHFDVKSVRLLPLQGNGMIASALAGGRADAAIFNAAGALPLAEKGEVKILGWIGDETGFDQAYLFMTQAKIANERPDTVRHVLAAFRHGARDYHDAFTDAHGHFHDEASAPEILDILAKYIGQPPERVHQGLPYFDPEARIDAKDVQHQIDWYRSQGLLKGEVSAAKIIDKRYAVLRMEK